MNTGTLFKMATELASPVNYSLVLDDTKTPLNPFIGKTIKLSFTGNIECIHCHRKIKKTYNQGYCFPCTQKLARCDFCILKPENCHYHLGTCREPNWGLSHCFVPHIVYLANSTGVKVGITRETQVPTRWIDQGAVLALPIFKVESRYQSGLIEVAIAKHMSDKTNWRKMLQNHVEEVDLKSKRDMVVPLIRDVLGTNQPLLAATPQPIEYPVLEYPSKINSLNLDKTPVIEGTLLGIKGQYLILDKGVINMRKYTGYEVRF